MGQGQLKPGPAWTPGWGPLAPGSSVVRPWLEGTHSLLPPRRLKLTWFYASGQVDRAQIEGSGDPGSSPGSATLPLRGPGRGASPC